ncbi:hypothetical protein [Runella sp. SP2]|uniref:hypothetical protein n=1 Tax=Runella sp. SP2 TaxID=2268026 RepID=UPI000F07C179|nr:hypothetical protein [Runella sp. SP2]AYQ31972.1 hypothetical protein DTQ70_07205 [Runella sp. SP2]
MAKLKYNVGSFVGLSGTGVLYLGVTDAGRTFLYTLNDHDGNSGTAPIPAFISRSSVVNAIQAGVAGTQLAKIVDYANLLETAPDGLIDGSGLLSITNAPATAGTAGYPRTWDGSITMFAIKGSDVTTVPTDKSIVTSATLSDWMAGVTTDATANTTDTNGDGIPDTPTTTSTGFTAKLADFAKENPYTVIGLAIAITILIVLLYQQYFKKKGKRRR